MTGYINFKFQPHVITHHQQIICSFFMGLKSCRSDEDQAKKSALLEHCFYPAWIQSLFTLRKSNRYRSTTDPTHNVLRHHPTFRVKLFFELESETLWEFDDIQRTGRYISPTFEYTAPLNGELRWIPYNWNALTDLREISLTFREQQTGSQVSWIFI